MQSKKYIIPNDVLPDLHVEYNSGSPFGYQTGFDLLFNKLTLRSGFYSTWYGWPQHGKTTLVIAFCTYIAKLHKKRFLIYCPEEGDAVDIVKLILSTWTGKDFYNRNGGTNRLTPSEIDRAVLEFSQYFYIVPTYIKGFEAALKYLNDVEAEIGQPIWSMVIDPINTLITTHAGVAGEYEEGYSLIEHDCRKNKRHHILVTHPVDDPHKSSEQTQGAIKFLPPPSANNLMGGKTHFRRGQLMVGVWRPKAGLTNSASSTGETYKGNEVMVLIQKAKPRGSSVVGDYLLRYDEYRWNYYELDPHGNKKFPVPIDVPPPSVQIELPDLPTKLPPSKRFDTFTGNGLFGGHPDEEVPF
jgi:hypothetical protein